MILDPNPINLLWSMWGTPPRCRSCLAGSEWQLPLFYTINRGSRKPNSSAWCSVESKTRFDWDISTKMSINSRFIVYGTEIGDPLGSHIGGWLWRISRMNLSDGASRSFCSARGRRGLASREWLCSLWLKWSLWRGSSRDGRWRRGYSCWERTGSIEIGRF